MSDEELKKLAEFVEAEMKGRGMSVTELYLAWRMGLEAWEVARRVLKA